MLLGARLAHADDFFLKDKDTVVFYGDSITAQRLYTSYVESFVISRCPDRDIRFVHSGWGGDTVRGGAGGPIDKRLERDVIAWKPTVVTIMLGMNDASYRAFDEKIFANYKKGYEHIVATLKARLPDARLVLIEPSPFDDVTRKPNVEGGYNTVLVKYSEFVRELAKREGALSVDLNAPVVACLEKAFAESKETAQKILPDRVHPAAAGHLVMAKALLEGLRAPSAVSSVAIDAAEKKVVTEESTSVALIDSTSAALAWTQTDRALPLGLDMKDPAVALAARTSGMEALDRQLLKVTGLSEQAYELRIDGVKVADFTKEQLEKGVDLALHATPMQKQANDVFMLTRRRGDLAEMRWRQIVIPFEGKSSENVTKSLEGLAGLADEVRAEQKAVAKTKARKFVLVVRKSD